MTRTRLTLLLTLTGLTGGCLSDPQDARPPAVEQYVQGVQAYKRGDTDTALHALESSVAANPSLRMPRSLLGQIYRDRSDYKSAARQYEKLTELDPYSTENHYFLGVCYQLLQDYAGAVRAYLAGLNLNPLDFKSNMNLGTVLLATGDIDNAVRYLEKATQIDPKNANAWSNLGVAYDARGNYPGGEAAYRKAIALETNSPAVLQNLAGNLLMQKKTGEATYLCEQIVLRTPTDFTRTRLAEAYTLGGDVTRAEPLLDDILSHAPRYVPALTAKGNVLIRKYELSGFSDDKSRQAGVDALRRSLAINPQQALAAQTVKKYAQALPLGP